MNGNTIRERLTAIETELRFIKKMINGIGIIILAQLGVSIW